MPADLLNDIRVASPCNASWQEMQGDERVRFCALCSKNVYNLSAMSAGEAEALARDKEGKLCARFYRRRDGTVLTGNCPRGVFAMRRALITSVGGLAILFAAVPGLAGLMARSQWKKWSLWQQEPYHSWAVKMGVIQEPPQVLVGEIAPIPLPPPPLPITRPSR